VVYSFCAPPNNLGVPVSSWGTLEYNRVDLTIYTSKYRAFPEVTEFSGDLLCEKKTEWAQCRIELTSYG
jgi:hypothetical protein